MEFRLRADKRALKYENREWVKDEARFAVLPNEPADMQVIEGTYGMVAAHAQRLNEIQFRNQRLDHIFSPDVIVKEEAA